MHIRKKQFCRICQNPNLKEVIDLGDQYLQGAFDDGKKFVSKRKIPNVIVRCCGEDYENACGLVQSRYTVPPEILYQNYWYYSSISNTMRCHLEGLVNEAVDITNKINNPSTLDIGMNDGFMLGCYPGRFRKVGIDPSDITKKAKETQRNIEVINECFPSPILNEEKFDIITSIACFYDLEEPVLFCEAIKKHLKQDGIWVFEMAYLPSILKNLCYDTFCAEHLEHYHLVPIERALKMAGLKLFNARKNTSNGGSIRCFACHLSCEEYENEWRTGNLHHLRLKEFDLKLDDQSTYDDFLKRAYAQRNQFMDFFEKEIIERGKKLHLYGASTKLNTLLQFLFEFSDPNEYIHYAAERCQAKIGAETLNGIKIISEEESRAMKPDYYLVGPWHFKDEIIKREKINAQNTAKLIFPLPEIEIV